ncbi:DUF4389 domain-containing protein [Candidatus Poriferisodalis sp.]|uniref:DUF4389 domain-containing protein n=1 Tax=Candidatus Poriferisodalis sp. TaxID=3101277 RepID=UPI003B014D2B
MDYPASVTVDAPDRVANWRPLVHWILLLPHQVIQMVFVTVAWLLSVLTWIVIFLTGKLPAGIANFQVMYVRHYHRVLSFLHIIHEHYPKFEFSSAAEDPGGSPVAVNIEAQLENRNRLTSLFRVIYGLPQIVFVIVYSYLVAAVVTIAYVIILFTGRWPTGMRNFVIGFYRAQTRCLSYIHALNDKYPPFSAAA